ncbi:MAG: tetratricopeptide repeat protein [Rhodothermales bacterium]
MKPINRASLCNLKNAVLTLTLLAFTAGSALAQETKTVVKEGQEYKMKYNEALEFAKAKKYTQAYAAYEEAIPLAEAAGDADIVSRSNKVLAQLDNSYGTRSFKAGNFEEALAHHEKGISRKNDYVPNHYGKAKSLEKLDRWDDAVVLLQAVMGMGDRKSANAAEKTIRGHYVYLASSNLSENPSRTKAQAALNSIEEMLGYVEADADAFYYQAEANKTLGNYSDAISLADQALSAHRGSRTDKAKIYFVKGEALMNSGSSTAAAEAFNNALYGNYKPLAQHYLDELKGGN